MNNINYKKKILFLGLGGAGQRHLRILSKYFEKNLFEFYTYRFKKKTPLLDNLLNPQKKKIHKEYAIKILSSLSEAISVSPDVIFICTPSNIRYSLIKHFKQKKILICVEKPLAISVKEIDLIIRHVKIYKQNLKILFQKRFHPHNILTKKYISKKKIGNIFFVKFISLSYMPNWHKYENFRKLYAANKKMGGGIILTECHEIDLCVSFFGLPISYNVNLGSRDSYKLDVYDHATIILSYKNFNVLIELDFLSKKLEKSYSIYGSKGFIKSDQISNKYLLNNHSKKKNIQLLPKINIDDPFLSQLKDIFNSNCNKKDFKNNTQIESSKIIAMMNKRK